MFKELDEDEFNSMMESLWVMIDLKRIYDLGFKHQRSAILNLSEYTDGYGYLDPCEIFTLNLGTLLGDGYASSDIESDDVRNNIEANTKEEKEDLESETESIENEGLMIKLIIDNHITREFASKFSDKIYEYENKLIAELNSYAECDYEYYDAIVVNYNKSGKIEIYFSGYMFGIMEIIKDIISFHIDIDEQLKGGIE